MPGYWDEYENADREESGGGRGGLICLATVDTGFKVYTGAVPQAETFFSADARDKASKEAAKAAAKALAETYGAPEARWSIQIAIPKETAYRVIDGVWQNVTWTTECRYFPSNTWTQAAKEVVVPSVQSAGVTELPATIWCRIGFKPDPYKLAQGEAGKTDVGQDGVARYPRVAYITEAFENEVAAKAAMSGDEASETPALPAKGWDFDGGREAWEAAVAGLKVKGAKIAVVAELRAMSEEKLAEAIGDATVEDVEAWWDFV